MVGSVILRVWLIKKRSGLTQRQVADMAGISRSYYTEIEKGTKTPKVESAKRLGEALGFDWKLFYD